MNREHCRDHNYHQRNADDWDKRARQYRQPAEKLDECRRPRRQTGRGNADCLKDIGESVHAFTQLRVSVSHKAEADNQAQRQLCPSAPRIFVRRIKNFHLPCY